MIFKLKPIIIAEYGSDFWISVGTRIGSRGSIAKLLLRERGYVELTKQNVERWGVLRFMSGICAFFRGEI